MKLAFGLVFGALLLFGPNDALAAGFTDSAATVIYNGSTCKKTTVQFAPPSKQSTSGKIVVSGGKGKCKKVGFAKKLGELTDVSWNDKTRSVSFSVEGGSTYSITIKKKANYRVMRQALIDAV